MMPNVFRVAVVLMVVTGCGRGSTIPAKAAVDLASVVEAENGDSTDVFGEVTADGKEGEHDAPDDASDDGDLDGSDEVELAADVSQAALTLHTSHKTLIPPPMGVTLTATQDGADVTGQCAWAAAPPNVCILQVDGTLHKVADGTCAITCTLADGMSASMTLIAKKQAILYEMGGTAIPDTMNLRIARFRVADSEWDDVGQLPVPVVAGATPVFWKYKPTLVAGDGALYLVGGGQNVDVDGNGKSILPPEYCTAEQLQKTKSCGRWAKYDLTTGAWKKMGDLVPNRLADSSVRVGNKVYLVGGTQLMVAPWVIVLDLPTETLTPLPTIDPGLQAIPALVPWPGGVLMIFGKGVTKLLKSDGTLVPIDIGLPASTVAGAFMVPGVPAQLFVDASTLSPSVPCKPTATQSWAVGLWFWRLDPTGWSKVDGYCAHSDIRDYWTPDGDLAIPAGTFSGSYPFEPVRRLATADGTWEELAPVTHWRTDFGAAVVEQ